MRILTLFRGALRHEYKMQIVKYLRAEEGELTRTDYRETWLAPGVREALEHERRMRCHIVLTDPAGTTALPLRAATLRNHRFQQGILHLELELGPFLRSAADLGPALDGWSDRDRYCPPACYVSLWQPAWPEPREVPASGILDVWRGAIDFVTAHWDFSSTAFLRLDMEGVQGDLRGPLLHAREGEERALTVVSYNPHLSADIRESMRLTARNTGDVAMLSEHRVPVERDGRMTLRACPMDAGRMELFLSVEPDHQFSTFFPLAIDAAPAPTARHSSVRRVVEREWRDCVGTILALHDSLEGRLDLLDRLDRALPNDPTVQLRRGLLLLEMDRGSEAYDCLSRALEGAPSDPDLVGTTLFAALRSDRTQAISQLLPRLDFSRTDLFKDLLFEVRRASDAAVRAVLEVAPTVLGDEKLLRLLQACTFAATSECTILALSEELQRFGPAHPTTGDR